MESKPQTRKNNLTGLSIIITKKKKIKPERDIRNIGVEGMKRSWIETLDKVIWEGKL